MLISLSVIRCRMIRLSFVIHESVGDMSSDMSLEDHGMITIRPLKELHIHRLGDASGRFISAL